MKTAAVACFTVCALVAAAWSGTDALFIGFSGEEAPAIEKNFTRLFQEQLATLPDVNAISGAEVLRLQSRINNFTYPAMTSSLVTMIRRCAPDTTLVIWIRAKSCDIKPVRHYFFGSAIQGSLTIEFSLYHLSKQAYAYIGETTAEYSINKGPIFWFGPIENAIQVSAQERSQILDKLQVEAASSASRILETVLYHEKVSSSKKPSLPPGLERKSIDITPSGESPYESETDQTDTAQTDQSTSGTEAAKSATDSTGIADTSGTK